VQEGHLSTRYAANQLFAVSSEHEHQDRGCRKYNYIKFEMKTAIAASLFLSGSVMVNNNHEFTTFFADEQVRMLEPVRGERGRQAL